MPKQRMTKEMVIDAAFDIARSEGMDRVMVKTIAEKLSCSVQPIYSYCENMDSLRREVAQRAKDFIRAYVGSRIEADNLFQSTGRAYIRVAKEEPHLFKIYIFTQRDGISSLEDLYRAEASPQMARAIAEQLHISEEAARQLHLHMLIYTIGIGTIFSVTASAMPEEEILAQQQRAYQALLRSVLEEKGDE